MVRNGFRSGISRPNLKVFLSSVLCVGLAGTCVASRPFTVVDDIELTCFGDPYSDRTNPVAFSPDGKYFAVQSGRGLFGQNLSQSSIRIYRTEDAYNFLHGSPSARDLPPLWTITKNTYKDGPIITRLKWLRDSTGITFLARTRFGNRQLFFADLGKRAEYTLTDLRQDVTGFDVRDRSHFIFAVRSPTIIARAAGERQASGTVGTGRSIQSLLFPVDLYPSFLSSGLYDLSELWAVVDQKRFRVNDKTTREPLCLHVEGTNALALSPNGRRLVTVTAVNNVPAEWESLYPPPFQTDPFRIRAGRQPAQALEGIRFISKYVLVELSSGEVRPITNAPTGDRAGWYGAVAADWAPDGKAVALSNTFVTHSNKPGRPCAAVADLSTGSLTCLEYLKGRTEKGYEEGWFFIENIEFKHQGVVRIEYNRLGGSQGSTTYLRTSSAEWTAQSSITNSEERKYLVDLDVRESFTDPPVLMASDPSTAVSKLIWDPNPQLKNLELGEASIFEWKDRSGRNWVGGLYKPADYKSGQRYPLVLQTHGFFKDQFTPSGVYPTGFAARELAAAGFLVLQVPDCRSEETPEEGPCNAANYESAVNTLISDGLADPGRMGIIGFSRSCYYVMETLTSSSVKFAAASITDGVNEGYLQYLVNLDAGLNLLAHDADAVNGAKPFGDGLQLWLHRSPEFKIDRVKTPLQVVASDPLIVLGMWEPYAALRYLNQPVDLVVLGPATHVLSNPRQRLVSQGGTVDWFRFWLKGEEDSDPAKAEQYARWRDLRKLQEPISMSDHSD